ncbi:hypothetical protein CCC_02930 [Paramagnetospirillum magnetotacticum MS-1]|uniref:DUF599 domain-containing protein n=1 Tax=Paramagnetospirillum magnetotacticum MS-1 TaxID=272627 RepID=A0A0C2V512_PARME|nr:DUF599 domain-containing protein [Paramagnetospirillum magnetotacticum]KIM00142.1 hypothetical protein CCC_02930 [Paramagnetospirillum magnetotacticum MS-1]
MNPFALLPAVDLAAFAAFLVLWTGYTIMADRLTADGHTLLAATARLRLTWMRNMCDREVRVADSALLGNLMRSVSFFASASILILGGLVALLGAGERAYAVIQDLPLVAESPKGVFETKVVLLAGVFVYAFFQITWSLRQFNYCCVLLGAAPLADAAASVKDVYAENAARLNALAAHSFNRGLRAYYFALALMTWFIHAGAMVAATTVVVAVLYRREFRSKTLRALNAAVPPG